MINNDRGMSQDTKTALIRILHNLGNLEKSKTPQKQPGGLFGWRTVTLLALTGGIGLWYYAGAPGSEKMNEIGRGLLERVGLA